MSKAKEIELLTSNIASLENKISALTSENQSLLADVENLKKEVATQRQLRDEYFRQKNEYSAQLEQINQFLDAVPNPTPRKSSGQEQWNSIDLTIMTRLAVWLGRSIQK